MHATIQFHGIKFSDGKLFAQLYTYANF